MRRAKFSCTATVLTLLLIIFCQGDREEAARMVPILIGFADIIIQNQIKLWIQHQVECWGN